MNMEDSQNVVVRRRKLVEDVNILQANVINANKNLLKLQVNQDANFWHLKEKYDQVKGARERLQQNMLQLQMEFEAVSAECQQERRLRDDTVNKLDSTRKLCDELERLVEQSKQAYAKTKADQQALYDAYLKSDKVVQKLEQDHLRMKEEAEQCIRELEGKVTQTTAQLSQMSAVYSECQQRANAELSELRTQLREARVAERELAASTSKLGAVKATLEQREATISSLQRDMRIIIDQMAEAKNILMKMNNDLKSANEEIESLKRALSNQEQFTKTQCDHNSELQEKLALLEEERQKDIAANDAYKIKIEEMNSMCQTLNSDVAMLREENDNLTKELIDKQETLSLYDEKLESLMQQLMQYDFKLDKLTLELDNTKKESQKHVKKILEVETAFANYREATEEMLNKQATIIEDINKEQEVKTSIINKEREERLKLEKELELQTEALNRANVELQSTKDERDTLVVELQNKTEIIKQMDEDLQLKSSAMLQNKEKYDKLVEELQKQTATIEEINMELEGKISALAQEEEDRVNLEAALRKMKRDWDTESEITKEKEKNLKERVSQLETGIKAKDEELSREMANFLQGRNQLEKEKCALQEVINGLEKRINNIVKEASNIRRDIPEPDDNAVMPTPHRELPSHSPVHPQTPGSFQDTLFSYFSEPSADSQGLQPQEPRYFAFASHSEALPPAPSPTKKRTRPDTPPVHGKSARGNVAAALQPQEPRYFAFASRSRSEALPHAPTPTKKRTRPDTPPVHTKSARANVAAADSILPPETKPKPYRFFKSRGNTKKK